MKTIATSGVGDLTFLLIEDEDLYIPYQKRLSLKVINNRNNRILSTNFVNYEEIWEKKGYSIIKRDLTETKDLIGKIQQLLDKQISEHKKFEGKSKE